MLFDPNTALAPSKKPDRCQYLKDVTGDGKVDIGLKLSCPPVSTGVPVKRYIFTVRDTATDEEWTLYGNPTANQPNPTVRFAPAIDGRAYAAYVLAESFNGQKSAWSSRVDFTPSKKSANTDAAAGLTVAVGFRENTLKWTKASQADHKWTAVYRRTTSGPGAWALLDTIKGTRFVDKNITPGTAYDYKINHVDTSDNEGPDSSFATNKAAVYIVDGDLDATAPSVVAAPTLTLRQYFDGDGTFVSKIKIAWSWPGGSVPIKGYEVKIDDGTDVEYVKTKNLSHIIKNAIVGVTYTVTISAISVSGAPSAFTNSTSLTPTAKSSTSGLSASFTDESGYGYIAIGWTQPTIPDYDYTEVRFASTPLLLGASPTIVSVKGNFFAITGHGSRVFKIRHFDRSGNTAGLSSVNTATGFTLPNGWLDAGSVGAAELGNDAVTRSAIMDGEVINSKIADPTSLVALGSSGLNVGGVGTVASLKNNSGGLLNAGTNTAGSNLSYSDNIALSSGSSPSGTWQCMGRCGNGNVSTWLRVS